MEDIQLIDKYINDELSETEVLEFEKRLSSDEKFAAEYESITTLQQGIRLSKLEEKLDFLKEVEAKEQKESKIVKMTKRPNAWLTKLSIAASIIILVGFGLWKIFNPDLYTSQELFASNFEPDTHFFNNPTRGDNSRQDCYANYSNKKWDLAIQCLSELIADEDQTIDHYFQGIAYMGLGQPLEALKSLDMSHPVQGMLSEDKLNWYRSLALVQSNQIQKAQEILSKIEDDAYITKAQSLFQDLEKVPNGN